MILLGQRLAELWIKRQEARGKQFPIKDPALRYRFAMRVLASLWALALLYVAVGGMERDTGARGALGQWLLVFIAMFGWVPLLILFVRYRQHEAAQSSAAKITDPNQT